MSYTLRGAFGAGFAPVSPVRVTLVEKTTVLLNEKEGFGGKRNVTLNSEGMFPPRDTPLPTDTHPGF
jgi:hypothetical protein